MSELVRALLEEKRQKKMQSEKAFYDSLASQATKPVSWGKFGFAAQPVTPKVAGPAEVSQQFLQSKSRGGGG